MRGGNTLIIHVCAAESLITVGNTVGQSFRREAFNISREASLIGWTPQIVKDANVLFIEARTYGNNEGAR